MQSAPDHPSAMTRRAGDFFFVAGGLSVDKNYQPVVGRQEAPVAALEKVSERLASAGETLEQLVKFTSFGTDITLHEEENE